MKKTYNQFVAIAKALWEKKSMCFCNCKAPMAKWFQFAHLAVIKMHGMPVFIILLLLPENY